MTRKAVRIGAVPAAVLLTVTLSGCSGGSDETAPPGRQLPRRKHHHPVPLLIDLELPRDETAEGYKTMDERHAIKVFLRP